MTSEVSKCHLRLILFITLKTFVSLNSNLIKDIMNANIMKILIFLKDEYALKVHERSFKANLIFFLAYSFINRF